MARREIPGRSDCQSGARARYSPSQMNASPESLEDLIRASSRAMVIGVGGGGDVVGALAAARFLEFCGLTFVLGGLSWERSVFDPIPGPRSLEERSEERRVGKEGEVR